MGCVLVGNLQLHTTVDHIGFQTIQLDDFGVAISFAKVLLCDCPEGIAVNNGMYTVSFGGFCIDEYQVGHSYRGHDGVLAVLALVDDRTIAADGVNIPVLCLDPGRNRLSAVILRACDFYKVTRFDGRDCRLCRFGRLRITAECCRNL